MTTTSNSSPPIVDQNETGPALLGLTARSSTVSVLAKKNYRKGSYLLAIRTASCVPSALDHDRPPLRLEEVLSADAERATETRRTFLKDEEEERSGEASRKQTAQDSAAGDEVTNHERANGVP